MNFGDQVLRAIRSRLGRVIKLHATADPRLIWLFYGIFAFKIGFLAFLVAVHPESLLEDDTPTYVEPAWSLLRDGQFAVDGEPEILRTPGYPFFLVPFLAVFGTSYVPAVVVAQFLLVAGTAGLVYGIARRLAAGREERGNVARLAFALVLVEPTLFLNEYNVIAEVLFTFLVTLAAYWLVRFIENESFAMLFLGILSLTAGAYVRPIALYLPLGLGAVGLAWFTFRSRWRHVVAIAVAVALHFGLTTAWSMRNEARLGERMFTTISHLNLFEYYGAAVKARAHGVSWGDTREDFQAVWDNWNGNDAQKGLAAADSAFEIMRAYPVETGVVAMRGLATTVLDPGTGSLANTLNLRETDSGIIYRFVSTGFVEFGLYVLENELALLIFLGFGTIWLIFMWGTAAWGVIRTQLGPSHVLLFLIIAYIIVLGSGPQSMARFRVPATPLILIFSAVGTRRIITRIRARGPRSKVYST